MHQWPVEKAPSNEGDQKKGADKPEKMEKLKKVSEGEEESKKDVAETSKMENIKTYRQQHEGND